ncbi:uncharacterized protein LOC100906232 [Galendromus occidentalis]|uniref:Uncharacterized protein LOC100906232 n=1 Tax=Galendromus occidentalis TaxID=34638 RepID=A0AAJ6QXG3_9ACAR|nr:uncharacterized protein LOC100906232 [Galendromus occidentalis]
MSPPKFRLARKTSGRTTKSSEGEHRPATPENYFSHSENMSSDVDRFIEQVLTDRTFYVLTTPNNSPLENSFDLILSVLQVNLSFSGQAVVVPYDGCVIIELSRELKPFVIVLYEGEKYSALLIQSDFPNQEDLIELLNQCMLTFWTPVELDSFLLSGILIAFTDGSLEATANYKNEYVRISMTIENIFVERVLLRLHRDDHLEMGLRLLQEALTTHLKTLHLDLPPLQRFKIEGHISISKDRFTLKSASDSITFVKFLANFASIRGSP